MNAENINHAFKKIPYAWLLLLFLAFVGTSIFILASVPPVSRDALTHHLFVPRLYLEHGGIYEIPSIPFSYYPMNLDLLYMIPLYFGNDILPKYMHFSFALLTALLIYNYLKTRISKNYGLLGALFFLSIPIIVKLSITVYVDLGLMFFSTASLLLLLRWLRDEYKLRYLLLAGICCGLAAGTKYNGLVSLFLLSLFTPLLYIRSRQGAKGSSGRAIGFAFLFITASLLAYSPWLIRNYTWTGNPIYPLHNTFFQQFAPNDHQGIGVISHQNPPIKQSFLKKIKTISNSGGNVFASRKILYQETWWQALLLPVRFFFQGQDDNPRYFDGKLNPFLFLLPFFAFLRKADRQQQLEKYALLAFSVLFFFFTFFQEAMRIRYIVAIVPCLVLLALFGLQNLSIELKQRFPRASRTKTLLPFLVILLMLANNGQYMFQQFRYVRPFDYLTGKISRKKYIARYVQEYPVVEYANQHRGNREKTLCLFVGNRGYYMDFPHVFDVPTTATSFFNQLILQSRDPLTIRQALQQKGYTRILLRNDLTNFWLNNLKKHKNIAAFFFQHQVKLIYSKNGYSLFDILPD